MTISKQVPLLEKSNTYAWRGILPTSATLASNVPVCTNGFFDANESAHDNARKIAYCKRPGVIDAVTQGLDADFLTVNAGERIRGLCTSLDGTNVLWYSEISAGARYSNIYSSTAGTTTQTAITASFGSGNYAFTVLDNVNYGPNVAYAAVNSGSGAYGALITTAGVWSLITDVDYTNNGVKTNFVGLDGYLFYGVISGTNAGRIYNSDLSAAAAASGWTSTSYVSANDVPGNIVWLGRIRNMVVCFKQFSIEFFEDVGNPTPGSPLSPRRNLIKRVGCASASSIQEVSDGIIFLGINQLGKMKYYKLMRDSLELTELSDNQMDAMLNTFHDSMAGFRTWSPDYAIDVWAGVATSQRIKGQSQVINYNHKEFYTTIVPSATDDTPITMVFDNKLNVWTRWTTSFGTAATPDGTFIPSMSFLFNYNNGGYITTFANNYSGNAKSRFGIMVTPSNAISATISANAYKDQGGTAAAQTYNFGWQCDFMDFGTGDRKFLHTVEIFYDSDPDQSAASATTFDINLYNFEKDYNFINSGSTRTCTIDNAGHRRAVFRQLGSFRRKAFRITDASGYPLRIWALELVYSGGPQYA